VRSVDALLHPVRLRIATLVAAADGPLSAKQIAARLADVPHATLYRHVRALADAGWLVPAETRPARGAVEVRFTLGGDAVASAEDVADASLADHRRWFSVFVASLLEGFGRYARQPDANPVQDGVRYRQVPLRLDPDALVAFHRELDELVDRYRGREGRPRLVALVTLPDPDRPS